MNNKLTCIIEGTDLVDNSFSVEKIILPAYGGPMIICPGHASICTVLTIGIIKLVIDGHSVCFLANEGVAWKDNSDKMVVIVQNIIKFEDLDLENERSEFKKVDSALTDLKLRFKDPNLSLEERDRMETEITYTQFKRDKQKARLRAIKSELNENLKSIAD